MARWSPERRALLESLAGEILHNYGHGRAIVAVDGRPGSGQAEFADDLGEALRRAGHDAVRASLDDFRRPRADREAAGLPPGESRYRETDDVAAFRRALVAPFRLGTGASFVTAHFDHRRDSPIEPGWVSADADAVLVVDGAFLQRADLHGLWNMSIWVDAPDDARESRLAALPAVDRGADEAAWRLYTADLDPRTTATAIVDVADPEHPVRRLSDWCVAPPRPH